MRQNDESDFLTDLSTEYVSFDMILDKIGFGIYQMRIFLALFILGASEAA